MRSNILWLVVVFLVLSSSAVYAGNAFMDIGTKQGWFIPNDYETSMNPPACILRDPTKDEYKALFDFCKGVNDPSANCDDQIKGFLDLWAKNNCQTLGMKIRTLPDGSLRSYFPPKPTAIPTLSPPVTPTSSTNQLQEAQQQLQKKREFNYLEVAAISAIVATASIAIYNKLFSRKKR